MDGSYLTFDEFRVRAKMPAEDIDVLEEESAPSPSDPGFVRTALLDRTAEINDRLKKRYVTPFGTWSPSSTAPPIVKRWLAALVTYDCYDKRGQNAGSDRDDVIERMLTQVDAQIKEAADSVDGLFELPLLASAPGESGVSKGGPFGYSEASPYSWMDEQASRVRGGCP